MLVATIRALKYHGGAELKELTKENLSALEKGITNLERHVNNVRNHYGLPCVVSINHFTSDTDAEIALLRKKIAHHDAPVVVARHWADGGTGAEELARTVVDVIERVPSDFRFVYDDADTLWDKMTKVATKIYGASEVTADSKVRAQIKKLQDDGYGHYPVCVAKTQYSFSTDPSLRGAPSGHVVNIREVRLAAGAEFIVMICGDVMTMPGLPKEPSAARIDIDADGQGGRAVLSATLSRTKNVIAAPNAALPASTRMPVSHAPARSPAARPRSRTAPTRGCRMPVPRKIPTLTIDVAMPGMLGPVDFLGDGPRQREARNQEPHQARTTRALPAAATARAAATAATTARRARRRRA